MSTFQQAINEFKQAANQVDSPHLAHIAKGLEHLAGALVRMERDLTAAVQRAEQEAHRARR